MPGGFTSPGIIFAGNSASSDRRFYRPVLAALHRGKYKRYVELGVGAFAVPLIARDVGWQPEQMETSDVTLLSSVMGTVLDPARTWEELDIRVDGEPVEVQGGSRAAQGAYLLWLQLLYRAMSHGEIPYWQQLAEDLEDNADEHQQLIARSLESVRQRVSGLRYRPADMFDHAKEVVGDPEAVVWAAPPSYKSGFEKFFDTGGRMTWAEPSYQVFDPDTDMQKLMDMFTGQPALLVFLQETLSRQACHPRPVYARQMGPGWTAYVVSNRPDEIFAITGGPKVVPRKPEDVSPSGRPPLPLDYEITPKSLLALIPVQATVGDYYRQLWMHRLTAKEGSFSSRNVLVLVDGYAAGVIGFSVDTIVRPYSLDSKWERYLLLRFAIGAPHNKYRLTRLATLAALQKRVAAAGLGETLSLYLTASEGLVTVEYSRWPESKGLRGLMKMADRKPHPDGHALTYAAEWQDLEPGKVLAEWLRTEERWQRQRAKQ